MLLSIITINKNNASGLNKTFRSVVTQTKIDFEYIVIDGASNDNSLDIITEFEKNSFQRKYSFKWISQADSGIYNAMNKGIQMANGKYLLFLNSGDWLADNKVVENIFSFLNQDYDIISGELTLIKDTEQIKLSPPGSINLNYCIKHGLTHPNTFIRKQLFDKYGYYNENNRIISDWEFFLVACGINKCKYLGIPVLISCFTMDGISVKNDTLMKQETKAALKRLLPLWKKIELILKGK